MSTNNNFKQKFDTLRAETYQIIESAHSPENLELSHEERRQRKQENITKLEDKLASYISMLNALDREIGIRRWREVVERMQRVFSGASD